jgi:hypothetical protein
MSCVLFEWFSDDLQSVSLRLARLGDRLCKVRCSEDSKMSLDNGTHRVWFGQAERPARTFLSGAAEAGGVVSHHQTAADYWTTPGLHAQKSYRELQRVLGLKARLLRSHGPATVLHTAQPRALASTYSVLSDSTTAIRVMSSTTRSESSASKSSASTNPTSVSDASASSSRSSEPRRGPAQYPASVRSSVLSSGSKDAFKDIQKLLDLLHEYKIPGPRLLRLKKDFKDPVGSGTQGQVRAASKSFTESLALATGSEDERLSASAEYWPKCVVKRLRISDNAGKDRSPEERLKLVADSALSEVQSLCRAKRLQTEMHKINGRKQLNVVALAGWVRIPYNQ